MREREREIDAYRIQLHAGERESDSIGREGGEERRSRKMSDRVRLD